MTIALHSYSTQKRSIFQAMARHLPVSKRASEPLPFPTESFQFCVSRQLKLSKLTPTRNVVQSGL